MSHEYERVETPASGLRLHLNENTAGCSPRVIAAIQELTREQMAFYPGYGRAEAACAERFGVPADHLLLTNGMDEGILATSIVALRGGPGNEAIVVEPAFDMYASCADGAGGTVVTILPDDDLSFPLMKVLDAIGASTTLVFLTSPNNPTGLAIPRHALLRIIAHASHALVFLDEAYIDFGGTSLLPEVLSGRFPNVIIGRTFAKAYGLAGLRAGALLGKPDTLAPLRRVVPPFSMNVCAAAALPVALADREHYDWYVAQVAESRNLLQGALSEMGVRFWKSDANFVLACFGEKAAAVIAGLAARGIIVRDRSRAPGCAGCVRISAGVVEHTRAAIAALEEVLCGAQ
jgi:histidinol-phosphate aminotransferase